MKNLRRKIAKKQRYLKAWGRDLKRSYIKNYWHGTIVVLVFLLVLFATAFITNVIQYNREVGAKQQHIQELESRLSETHTELLQQQESAKTNKDQVKELRKREATLRDELEALKASKANSGAVYASAPSGSCADWIKQAGVSDVTNAHDLIMRESGCRTSAVNPYSGACGIPQALPCSKLGSARGNPVAEIRWMDSYIKNRYGSWANANAFQRANNYY